MKSKKEKAAGPKLAKEDLTWGIMGSSRGGSASARVGRAVAITGRTVWVEHTRLGIRLEEAIPEGHYSKGEMKRLTNELYRKLLGDLEKAVARKLRLPGRQR